MRFTSTSNAALSNGVAFSVLLALRPFDGTVHGMRVAIDASGRLVVPKPLRDEMGLVGAAELEMQVADGRLELVVPDLPARVEERDGLAVIVIDGPQPPPLTTEETRAAIERVRR